MSKIGESSIVKKCVNMVDVISLSQRPLTFSELAQRCGLVKSSAHRIIAILINERLVSYDESTKTYTLGNRSLTWARSFLRRFNLPNIADRHFSEFCRSLEMNGALSVRDQLDVLYLRTYDPVPVKFSSLAGDRAPLHCTAAGKVFLAYLPENSQRELLARIKFEPYTEFTLRDEASVLAILDDVRKQGFATAIQEEVFHVLGISAPIKGADGEVLAALSLWSQVDRVSPNELVNFARPLVDMAEQMSREYQSGQV